MGIRLFLGNLHARPTRDDPWRLHAWTQNWARINMLCSRSIWILLLCCMSNNYSVFAKMASFSCCALMKASLKRLASAGFVRDSEAV